MTPSTETVIEIVTWILWTKVGKRYRGDYRRFGVFRAGQEGKSTGISPVWSREMTWRKTEEALLVEILQRSFSA